MAALGEGWLSELEAWSEPFLDALEHPARRHWAPYYLRGLLLPGERKSVQRNVSTTLIHPVLAFRLGDQPCGWVD
jgi:hypothetical protein